MTLVIRIVLKEDADLSHIQSVHLKTKFFLPLLYFLNQVISHVFVSVLTFDGTHSHSVQFSSCTEEKGRTVHSMLYAYLNLVDI